MTQMFQLMGRDLPRLNTHLEASAEQTLPSQEERGTGLVLAPMQGGTWVSHQNSGARLRLAVCTFGRAGARPATSTHTRVFCALPSSQRLEATSQAAACKEPPTLMCSGLFRERWS